MDFKAKCLFPRVVRTHISIIIGSRWAKVYSKMGSSSKEISMFKAAASKAVVVKINIAFVVFVFVVSVAFLVLRPMALFDSNAASLARCTLSHCDAKSKVSLHEPFVNPSLRTTCSNFVIDKLSSCSN